MTAASPVFLPGMKGLPVANRVLNPEDTGKHLSQGWFLKMRLSVRWGKAPDFEELAVTC